MSEHCIFAAGDHDIA